MRRKIPNTTALVVFETASRHGSFSRAAKELCITESAVSRQITALESFLETKLFSRVRKHVILNDAGLEYAKHVTKILMAIETQTLALMTNKGSCGVLELAVIPTFANRWLLPRLREFRRLHPNILINLTEKPSPFSFQDTIFDAALHFDHPLWTGVTKIDLFEEKLVPVISPVYFDLLKVRSPADVLDLPLLHKLSRPADWQHWFEAADCSYAPKDLGLRFDMYGMVIEAALAGLGAGLVPRLYVNNEILRQELAVPFDIELKHEKRYCLVYPEHKQDSPVVQVFRDWIVNIDKYSPLNTVNYLSIDSV